MDKLFSLTLPDANDSSSGLYFKGNARNISGCLCFKKGDEVTFDTYFNCFSYSKIKKHTVIKDVIAHLVLEGDFFVELIKSSFNPSQKDKFERLAKKEKAAKRDFAPEEEFEKILEDSAKSIEIENEVLHSVKTSGECELKVNLDNLGAEGYFYLKLRCLSEKGKFLSGSYFTENARTANPKIGIVICTYKRENYVLNNVKKLSQFFAGDGEIKRAFEAVVVDNAGTLSGIPGDGITVLKNKNLGGAGGFTRGIIYLHEAGAFTHFLLMDDDLQFDESVLYKTYKLMCYAANPSELSIGGQMLCLDKRYMQFESGAYTDGVVQAPYGRFYNLTRDFDLLLNEREEDVLYCGWWYLCTPLAKAEKYGLPMPYFIKGDDVEYGMRTLSEILLVNGIGVWHERFENKYVPELDYYWLRNELITYCRHKKGGVFFAIKKLARMVAKSVVQLRYFAVDFAVRGAKDFLKGPKFLLETPADKLHMSLREKSVKQLSKDELKQSGYDTDAITFYEPEKYNRSIAALTLNGHLIPSVFYGAKRRFVCVDMTKCRPRHLYKVKKALQYNKHTKSGFITKKSIFSDIAALFKLSGASLALLFGFNSAKRKYLNTDMTSPDVWKKIFDGNCDSSPEK